MVPEVGTVLGIDVGWSDQNDTTGACILTWNKESVSATLSHVPTDFERRQTALRTIVGKTEFEAVGIDGPLRPNFDAIDEYRLAELLLTRRFSNAGFGKPGQSNSGNGLLLNQHANEIAKSVLEANCVKKATHIAKIDEHAIVESFPTTFLAVMLDDGRRPALKSKSDAFFESLLGPDSPSRLVPDSNRITALLSHLLPERRCTDNVAAISDHEHRAAFVCAITALCVVCRKYVAAGDARNGYIILPPRVQSELGGLRPWAIQMIEQNANEARDWQRDCLAVTPPAPHVILESSGEHTTFNAAY